MNLKKKSLLVLCLLVLIGCSDRAVFQAEPTMQDQNNELEEPFDIEKNSKMKEKTALQAEMDDMHSKGYAYIDYEYIEWFFYHTELLQDKLKELRKVVQKEDLHKTTNITSEMEVLALDASEVTTEDSQLTDIHNTYLSLLQDIYVMHEQAEQIKRLDDPTYIEQIHTLADELETNIQEIEGIGLYKDLLDTTKSIIEAPDNPENYYKRGTLFEDKLGDELSAELDYEMVLELDPNMRGAQERLDAIKDYYAINYDSEQAETLANIKNLLNRDNIVHITEFKSERYPSDIVIKLDNNDYLVTEVLEDEYNSHYELHLYDVNGDFTGIRYIIEDGELVQIE